MRGLPVRRGRVGELADDDVLHAEFLVQGILDSILDKLERAKSDGASKPKEGRSRRRGGHGRRGP